MKLCIKCNLNKELSKFENGRNVCRQCRILLAKEYQKSYYVENAIKKKAESKINYNQNIEYKRNQSAVYCKINHKKRMTYQKTYRQQRLLADVNFKLADILRSRLNKAIKNNQKSGSAVSDLGCSIEELKLHLESKFLPGMTWENHNLKGWHIDHKKPLSGFDLSDPEQLKEACRYTNLQPLWAIDNLKKGDKL